MNKLKNVSATLLLLSTLLLVGCAEKEEGSQAVVTSVFATSASSRIAPSTSASRVATASDQTEISEQNGTVLLDVYGLVEGLNVKCVEVSDLNTSGSDETAIISITDENGTFSHRPTDICSFSVTPNFTNWMWKSTIGDNGVITPLDLTTTAYVNTLRFFYSLDEDQNKTNGIKLTYGVSGIDPELVDFEDRWAVWSYHGGYNIPLVSEEYALGTADGAPLPSVVGGNSYNLSDKSLWQFYDNGALIYLPNFKLWEAFSGEWTEVDGVITTRLYNSDITVDLTPESLPLYEGTVLQIGSDDSFISVVEVLPL